MSEPTITLRPENSFYDIFPNGMVPVKSPLPSLADLETQGIAPVYMLDGERLTTRQMQDVAERIAEHYKARVRDVRDELLENGLPIRASEVAVHPMLELRMIL